MKEITPTELQAWREQGTEHQLIDVREPYEAELCTIGGTLIPLGEIVERIGELRKDVPVVIHCRSGGRSAAVINALSSRYGFENLVNLSGGILAFGREVDHDIQCD
ncbi:MAG: rhodanese-like domain-containing protein [Flavobacteriales bacterium]|nr:rhodanese-like domain-containing protein [Flavobacteriales bacterium]